MGETRRLLIAVGFNGQGVLMGCDHRDGWLAFDEGGRCPLLADDVMPLQGYPARPGVYLWRGRITIDGGGPHDDFGVALEDGEWSAASEADMIDLCGRGQPPPPLDEDREKIQEGDYHYYNRGD